MNDENVKVLSEKYSDLFIKHYYKDRLMPFWFECGDGWYNLVDCLLADIKNHVDNKKQSLDYKKERGETVTDEEYEAIKVTIVQIKEKYGGLRFYTYGSDDYVRGMIDMAESISYRVCEACGNPGTLLSKGWWRTLCDPCRADDARKKEEWEKNYHESLKKVKETNNG